MTPGAYLRRCREAEGMTLDDVALRIATLPPRPAIERAQWIASIEADLAPLAIATALRLATIYPINFDRLLELSSRSPAPLESRDDLRMCLRADGASIRDAAEAAIAAERRSAR